MYIVMNRQPSQERQKSRGKRIVFASAIAVVLVIVFVHLGDFFTFSTLQQNKDAIGRYAQSHYLFAVILFILTYAVITALALPGALILTLAGGFLFGVLAGTLYVNVGATIGATLAFMGSRYLFRDAILKRFDEKLKLFQQGLAKNAFHYLLMLRLIPLFPFFLINLLSGITPIRLSTYIGATALGIIPGSVVYCIAGQQLGSINSVQEIASPGVLGALTLLGLFALIPVAYSYRRGLILGTTTKVDREGRSMLD